MGRNRTSLKRLLAASGIAIVVSGCGAALTAIDPSPELPPIAIPTIDALVNIETPPEGEHAVEGYEWADRGEGGLSLVITPTQWARDAGFSGWQATWDEIVTLVPEADTPVMRDQLICHAIGAGHRPTWNLEAWRPDVGLVSVISALCNPTE